MTGPDPVVSVKAIEAVSARHELDVARALYKYCDHFTDTSLMLESPEPALAAFLSEALADPRTLGLPFNAYVTHTPHNTHKHVCVCLGGSAHVYSHPLDLTRTYTS